MLIDCWDGLLEIKVFIIFVEWVNELIFWMLGLGRICIIGICETLSAIIGLYISIDTKWKIV